MNTSPAKVYVDVIVNFDADGNMSPTIIKWEDGKIYPIDRVLNIVPAPAFKAGGQGDRYTISVLGKSSFLFFEHSPKKENANVGRWFVERRS